MGLAQGKTFDRSVLEDVKGYLTDQYFSRGKYGVQVDTQVDELPGNRVNVLIDIDEGERAKIRQISIVGNTKFKEKDILETFELKTPQLEHLVQAQRPLLARGAAGRPREAEVLVPGPRLRQLRHRVGPGDHLAREGRHVHHREHQGRRDLQDRRRQDRRQHHRAAASSCRRAERDGAQGPDLFAASHLGHAEVHREPAERPRATPSPRSIRCPSSTTRRRRS